MGNRVYNFSHSRFITACVYVWTVIYLTMGSNNSTLGKLSKSAIDAIRRNAGAFSEALNEQGVSDKISRALVDAVTELLAQGLSDEEIVAQILRDERFRMLSAAAVELVVEGLKEFSGLVINAIKDLPAEEALRAAKVAARAAANAARQMMVRGGAYGGYAKGGAAAIGGATHGGCACGGVSLATIDKYGGSEADGVKSAVIKAVLAFAKKDGASLSGGTDLEQLNSYTEYISKTGANNPERCEAVARHINEIYGSEVILMSSDRAQVCKRVYEILRSLRGGVYAEFLGVYADVNIAISNMLELQKMLKDVRDEMKRNLKGSDAATAASIETEIAKLDVVMAEMKRQTALLSNLMNSDMLQTEKALAEQMARGESLANLIEKVRRDGTSANISILGDGLRRSLVLTASVTLRVKKALEKLGISMKQFTDADTYDKLSELLLTSGTKVKDNAERMKNIKALLSNFDRRDEIISYASNTHEVASAAGEHDDYGGGDEHDSGDDGGYGGAHGGSIFDDDLDSKGYPMSNVAREQRAQKRLRDLLMSVFSKALNDRFDKFVRSLNIFADSIGEKIPITDDLTAFVEIVDRIRDSIVYESKIYYALVGYYGDALSKQRRDRFISGIQMVINHLNKLLEMSEYQSSASHLRDVKGAASNLIEIVEKYSEEVAQKFGKATGAAEDGAASGGCDDCGGDGGDGVNGGDDDGVNGDGGDGGDGRGATGGYTPTDFSGAGDYDGSADNVGGYDGAGDTPVYTGYAAAATGGASGGASGGAAAYADDVVVYRLPVRIGDALDLFKRRIRAAKILQNLGATASELPAYAKDHEDLIAKSIVEVLSKREKQRTFMLAQLDIVSNDTALVTQIGNDALNDGAVTAGTDPAAAGRAQIDAARKLIDGQYKALHGFWTAAEALDKRLRTFTVAVTRNADKIKDFNRILRDVEVISEWHGNQSGNKLVGVYERFPRGGAAFVPVNSVFHTLDANTHYYETVATGTNAATVGHPQNVTFPTQGLEAAKGAHTFFVNSMRALKNLFSIFIHSDKTAGEEVVAQQMKPPVEIYQAISSYLVASAFSQGFNLGDICTDDGAASPQWVATTQQVTYTGPGFTENVGMTRPHPGAGNANVDNAWRFLKRYGVFMRSIEGVTGNAAGGGGSSEGFGFRLEDQYFVSVLKAACASVLTLTGVIDLFHRPSSIPTGMTPLRMILGGADETPEVVSEATALYVRLPLLVQWYRDLFNGQQFQNRAQMPLSDTNIKIAMIPDIEGTFSGLIRLIFRDLRDNTTNSYTDDDVRKIVREVNLIYQRQVAKNPSNVVRGTIQDLINEVNRRYGIVSQETMKKYNDGEDRMYRRETYTEYDEGDLAILPGEGEGQPPRLTPSERMIGSSSISVRSAKPRYSIVSDHQSIVKDFRCAVEKALTIKGGVVSLDEPIRSAQQFLKSESRPDRRFDIVSNLIRGASANSGANSMKLVLFNETVIAGLNTLSAIHTMLYRFQQRMIMLDINGLRKHVVHYLENAGAGYTMANLVTHVRGRLVAEGTVRDHLRNEALLENIFGIHQDSAESGGGGGVQYTLRAIDGIAANNVPRIGGGALGVAAAGGNAVTNGTGLISLLNGMPFARIKALIAMNRPSNADKADYEKVQTFFRFLFDRQFVMKELLESVIALSNDECGHVKATLSADGTLQVTYGGLTENIRELFGSVYYFLTLLRPHVSDATYEKYTAKTNLGSYYWLQEALNEHIIVGRDARGTSTAYPNLDKISHLISSTWATLTEESGNGAGIGAAAATVSTTKSRTSYFRLFAEMVFYDAERVHSGIYGNLHSAQQNGNPPLIAEFRSNPYDALLVSGPPEKKVLDTRFIARFQQLYTWGEELTLNRSLLFGFNQLVAKFIQAFYDTNTGKIYQGLLDKFANGVFAQSLADFKHTYPDTVPCVQLKFSGAARTPTLSTSVLVGQSGGRYRQILAALKHIYGVQPIPAAAPPRRRPPPPLTGADRNNNTTIVNIDTALWASGAAQLGYQNAIQAALDVNPFAGSMLGSGEADLQHRIGVLAALLTYADSGRATAGAAAAAGVPAPALTVADISGHMLKVLRESTLDVPTPGGSSGPKHIVPADDLPSMDDSDPGRDRIVTGSTEKSALLFARSGDGTGANIAGLGVQVPTGVPTDRGSQIAFGRRMDPTGDTVLFSSLAWTLRTLMASKSSSCPTCSVYVTDNIAEVPLHMKEKMRASLPVFRRLLSETVKRAEFIKNALTQKHVNMERQAPTTAPKNVWPFNLQDIATGSAENKNRLVSIIDTIVSGCNALIGACVQVLREVGDDPKYLEFHKDFIREQAQQRGINPFMPLSNSLVSLQNLRSDTYTDFLPMHSLGEAKFKMLYGARALLDPSTKPTLESNVGFSDIVAMYNMLAGSASSVDQSRAAAFLEQFAHGLRYVNCLRTKGFVSSHVLLDRRGDGADINNAPGAAHTQGAFVRDDLVVENTTFDRRQRNATTPAVDNIYAASPYAYNLTRRVEVSISAQTGIAPQGLAEHPSPVYALRKKIEDVTRITDSSNRDESIQEFIKHLTGTTVDPENITIHNVLDLDIMPINFHGLMRELPFASTLNYAYSFDRLIVDMFYGAGNANANKIIEELCDGEFVQLRSAKDAFVALLINPYMKFSTGDSSLGALKHIAGMMRGGTSVDGLSRPKFLSDELFGKTLFGELYADPGSYSEMGPGAGHAISSAVGRDAIVRLAAQLLNLVLTASTGIGMAAVATPGLMPQFCAYIASYYVSRPTAKIATVQGLIVKEKELDTGKFRTLVEAAARPGRTLAENLNALAWAAAIAGKVSAAAAIALHSGLDKGVTTAATNADAIFRMIPAGGIAAPAAAPAGAAAPASVGAQLVAPAVNASLRWIVNALTSDDSTVPAIPIDTNGRAFVVNQVAPGAAITDAANARDATNAAYNQSRSVASLHAPTKLHYLSTAATDLADGEDGGVIRQPDNRNVIDPNQVKVVDVGAEGPTLAKIGAMRFDTILCRNIIFVINLVRALRMHLQSELHNGEGRVLGNNANVAQRLTEAFGNEVQSAYKPRW